MFPIFLGPYDVVVRFFVSMCKGFQDESLIFSLALSLVFSLLFSSLFFRQTVFPA